MAERWITVGRVRSVNAGAREVRINARDGYGYVFAGLGWIRFQRAPDDVVRCKVVSVKGDEAVPVLALGPGVPKDVVGRLRGLPAVLAPGEMPPKPAHAPRLADWMDLAVILPTGETLGTVCALFDGPANDAFAVRRPDGSRCILPAVEVLVQAVDLERGVIEVRDVTPFIVEE